MPSQLVEMIARGFVTLLTTTILDRTLANHFCVIAVWYRGAGAIPTHVCFSLTEITKHSRNACQLA